MIVYEVATKELDTKSFPQQTITDLNSGITSIVLLSQEKPLRWKEINIHTHTRARARKLQNLPRITLITIYKAFVRPHLNYGDISCDQAFNSSFHDRVESVQYNACLVITGAIMGISKEKLYQELGLESLRLQR